MKVLHDGVGSICVPELDEFGYLHFYHLREAEGVVEKPAPPTDVPLPYNIDGRILVACFKGDQLGYFFRYRRRRKRDEIFYVNDLLTDHARIDKVIVGCGKIGVSTYECCMIRVPFHRHQLLT